MSRTARARDGRPMTCTDVRGWEPTVRAIASGYFIPGADREDVLQEARAAVLEALADHKPGRAALRTFVILVVHRRLRNHVRDARTPGRMLLTNAKRVAVNEDGETVAVLEVVAGGRDPADVLADREEHRRLIRGLATLTVAERRSLAHVVFDVPYHAHGVTDRAVDNGIQRARRKLRDAA